MVKNYLKKIVILGTTGSGKTTFLKNLVGDFEGAEVKRQVVVEEAQILNTFTPHKGLDLFADSTTTVSMNAKSVLFLTTRTNQFQFYPLTKELPIPQEDMDQLMPTMIIDTAGQERFSFMQEIGLNGADGVFIFADGSNIGSIERVTQYLEMIENEATLKSKNIPIMIFVNKKDLEAKGLYVGADALKRYIDDSKENLHIYETSNLDIDSFMIPIRIFLSQIEGFPIDAQSLAIKSIHEIY